MKPHRIELGHLLHVLSIICSSKSRQTIRIQLATLRVELLAVLIGELCAKAVQGDDEGSAVSLKLDTKDKEIATDNNILYTLLYNP